MVLVLRLGFHYVTENVDIATLYYGLRLGDSNRSDFDES